ncbi:hypothetical protein [Streptomyces sp. NPDC088915]|uniref:hypothetical protein n=1 Tax=Streptomyces sp. NPDC088915 TaxID=3365912 RepID=UPI003824A6E9
MGAVVWCAVLWAGAVAVTVRCVKQWRSGADQVWSSKWKVLAGALAVTAFPVMATARAVPDGAQSFFEGLAGLLLVGSAGSVTAGWVAARRSDTQTRAVHSGLGLPVERNLWSPWALTGLWSAAGTPFTAVEVLVVGRYIETHSAPAVDGTWAEASVIGWLSVLSVAVFVVIGLLHGFLQHRRRAREQQRVRNADQQYLAAHPVN